MPELKNKLDKQEKPAQPEFFRPTESDRLARAKRWLEQARGESPAANLQGQREDQGR